MPKIPTLRFIVSLGKILWSKSPFEVLVAWRSANCESFSRIFWKFIRLSFSLRWYNFYPMAVRLHKSPMHDRTWKRIMRICHFRSMLKQECANLRLEIKRCLRDTEARMERGMDRGLEQMIEQIWKTRFWGQGNIVQDYEMTYTEQWQKRSVHQRGRRTDRSTVGFTRYIIYSVRHWREIETHENWTMESTWFLACWWTLLISKLCLSKYQSWCICRYKRSQLLYPL